MQIYCLHKVYRLADASLVSPIKYLSLVVAIVAGYLIFSEYQKLMTLFGAGINCCKFIYNL